MKIVVFGLAITSSWGNGHATLWRGLCRALHGRGHHVTFFERDTPYYSSHRDFSRADHAEIVLYEDWRHALPRARRHVDDADAVIVTSYCPDGIAASELAHASRARLRVFYDMDTPVTLSRLEQGESLPYIGPRGLRDFDLVLSYTGGGALAQLRQRLGARHVEPLYGSVNPGVHHPVRAEDRYRASLSYLGTYAEERQAALEKLFIEPARRRSGLRFVIGGAMYPDAFPWAPNIHFMHHVAPGDHPAFYSSSRLTMNVTRHSMAVMGYCPSGRLFEATACGTAVLSDSWMGLDHFFTPGSEILITTGPEESLAALDLSPGELGSIARAGMERTLDEHTASHRARELERHLSASPARVTGPVNLPA